MNSKEDKYLSFIVVFIMILFAVRDILAISINPYVITLFLSLVPLFLSYKNIIAYSCFLLPLSCGTQSFIWIVLVGFILLNSKKISLKTVFIFSLFAILELLNEALVYVPSFDVKNTIFYIVSLFVVIYLVNDDNEKVDYSKNIRFFLYGTCFLLVVLFARIIAHSGIQEVLLGAIRYNLEDTSQSGDYVFITNANNLGLYSTICISVLLFIGKASLKLSKLKYLILFIVAFFGGMLTFSRTWLILTFIAFILYLIIAPKNKSYLYILFSFIVVVVIAVSSGYLNSVIELFETRMTADDVADGAGRTDLFELYNKFFLSHPQYWLSGTGAVYYQDICQQPLSMHNMFQQVYVCYGLIGSLGVLYFLTTIYVNNRKYVVSKMQYLPLIFYLIFVQSVQFFNPIFCMYPLVICVCCIKSFKNKHYEIAGSN